MNIIKYRWLYYTISLILIVSGLVVIAQNGLQLGVDFTGGSVLEARITTVTGAAAELDAVKSAVAENETIQSVQAAPENVFIFKASEMTNEQKDAVLDTVGRVGDVEELTFDSVGPTLSRELLMKTIWSVVLVTVCITLYIWRQFKQLQYGVCATLAMFHDILVVLGVYAFLGVFYPAEIDTLFVTALLTTLTFSVHDTIVMYDRIRELRMLHPKKAYPEVVNAAVLQTLARSYNTSFIIITVLAALALIGGESIRWFAVALLIGAVTGAYSSPFVSVPLLVEWGAWVQKKKTK